MPKFKLDYKAYLKRVIILSWFALAICFAIKLFGGDLFTIVLEDNTAKAVFEYVDSHVWANYIVSALYCAVSLRFFALAIAQRISFKTWEKILYIITVLAGTAVKLWSYEWGYLYDIWQVILFPLVLIIREPRKILNILYANVALIVVKIISM